MKAAGWLQESWKAEGTGRGSNKPESKKGKNKMKKLMIAALAATFVGAAFAACKPGKDEPIEDAWVYTWKFTGKTTTGVLISYTISPSGNCKPGKGGVYGCAIRVPSALNIQGYTYKCLPCCDGYTELADDGEVFWTTKPQKELFEITDKKKVFTKGITIDFGHVIGKKARDFELLGEFGAPTQDSGELYDFVFAGLGKYDLKNTRFSSVSGNFAGVKINPHYLKYDEKLGGCPDADYWVCDGSAYAGKPTDPTVAYGSWSAKLNSSASKKFLKSGTLVKVPVK